MRQLTPRISAFLSECLVNAVCYGLILALFFLPIGIIFGVVSRNPIDMLGITFLGGFLGILMGIGQVFIDRFSEKSLDEKRKPEDPGKVLFDFYFGSLKSPWWNLLELGQKILEKDDSRQRPGRAGRGLIGAVACMILITLLFGCVALTSTRGPAPGFAIYFLALLAMAGIAGGIAGALTDSR